MKVYKDFNFWGGHQQDEGIEGLRPWWKDLQSEPLNKAKYAFALRFILNKLNDIKSSGFDGVQFRGLAGNLKGDNVAFCVLTSLSKYQIEILHKVIRNFLNDASGFEIHNYIGFKVPRKVTLEQKLYGQIFHTDDLSVLKIFLDEIYLHKYVGFDTVILDAASTYPHAFMKMARIINALDIAAICEAIPNSKFDQTKQGNWTVRQEYNCIMKYRWLDGTNYPNTLEGLKNIGIVPFMHTIFTYSREESINAGKLGFNVCCQYNENYPEEIRHEVKAYHANLPTLP